MQFEIYFIRTTSFNLKEIFAKREVKFLSNTEKRKGKLSILFF